MVLSGQSIRRLKILDPFCERSKHEVGMSYGVGAASYDLRVKLVIPNRGLVLRPGEFALVSTLEKFLMPNDVAGFVKDKSTLARLGLSVFNTFIDPGWRGYLTLELKNLGCQSIQIIDGYPIAQVVFEKLDYPAENPYDGKYQDQESSPTPAKFK